MKRILVCEDEDSIRDFVVLNLVRSGYDVTDVSSGEAAIEEFDRAYFGDSTSEIFTDRFSVVLLDIMMPGIDGVEVCKHIRQKCRSVGIVMLSAKAQEMDKVHLLMLGADDYITKPFSPSELIARVDAIYRRVSISREPDLAEFAEKNLLFGPFCVDRKNHTVSKNGKSINASQIEYNLLEFFISHPGDNFDRDTLLKLVWGSPSGDHKTVDVTIRRLRMKIEDNPASPIYIQTVWSIGYRWNPDANSMLPPPPSFL